MSKKKYINTENFTNPFLSEDREKLWEKAEQNAKPVSKEEVLKRALGAKKQSGNMDKEI